MGNRYSTMSEDELQKLAKQKIKSTESFKKTALAAQQELYRRHHWETNDNHRFVGLESYDERTLDDLQYNG